MSTWNLLHLISRTTQITCSLRSINMVSFWNFCSSRKNVDTSALHKHIKQNRNVTQKDVGLQWRHSFVRLRSTGLSAQATLRDGDVHVDGGDYLSASSKTTYSSDFNLISISMRTWRRRPGVAMMTSGFSCSAANWSSSLSPPRMTSAFKDVNRPS